MTDACLLATGEVARRPRLGDEDVEQTLKHAREAGVVVEQGRPWVRELIQATP